MQKLKERFRFFAIVGALGLLPGFIIAGVVGPMVGEVSYDIRWGILIPPVTEAWKQMSPFVIGWPSLDVFLQGMPLAIITYVILFGDMVTGNEVIRDGITKRQDEHIDINPTRTHLSVGIRNALMGIFAPFFPTQGAMWTGVQVIIVRRWPFSSPGLVLPSVYWRPFCWSAGIATRIRFRTRTEHAQPAASVNQKKVASLVLISPTGFGARHGRVLCGRRRGLSHSAKP